jgi:hypothetical protein
MHATDKVVGVRANCRNQHARRDSPAAVKFMVVDVRVGLPLMGLNCIVYWLQVMRLSAVRLDFVIVFVSEQDLRDKIGPIANKNVLEFVS